MKKFLSSICIILLILSTTISSVSATEIESIELTDDAERSESTDVSLELSSDTVSLGEKVEIKVTVTGPKDSYIVTGSLHFEDFSNYRGMRHLEFTSDDSGKVATATFEVTEEMFHGDWTTDIYVYDNDWDDYWIGPSKTITVDNPNGDFEGPTVVDYEYSSEIIQVDEDFTIKVKLADSAGVESATVYLSNVSEGQSSNIPIYLTYDEKEDIWEGSYTFEQNRNPGLWEISINAWDQYQNVSSLSLDAITFINENPDVEGPIIKSTNLSMDKVLLGDVIQFEVKAYDVISEVDTVEVELTSQVDYSSELIELQYNEESDIWVGSYRVNHGDITGLYDVLITARDNLYNWSHTSLEKQIEFNITETDNVKPIINEVEITPKQVSVGETVTFKVFATDDKAGIEKVRVSVWLYENDYSNDFEPTYHPSEDAWIVTHTVSEYDQIGKIHVYVYAEDYAGNQAETFRTSFEIVESKDDEGSETDGSDDDTVLVTVTAKDIKSAENKSVIVIDSDNASKQKVNLDIDSEVFTSLVDKGDPLQIHKGDVELEILLEVLHLLKDQANDHSVTISLVKVENAPKALGPIYDFTITADGEAISDFQNHNVILKFQTNEELVKNLKPDQIKAFYLNESKDIWEVIEDSVYDPSTGIVTAATTHFSTFGVLEYEQEENINDADAEEKVEEDSKEVDNDSPNNTGKEDDEKVEQDSKEVNNDSSNNAEKDDDESSDELKENDQKPETENTEEGETLPKTATNTGNMLLFGLVFMVLGSGLLFIRKKSLRLFR